MALRVALLSYRSRPHSGGQGIYVRHLSRELVRLGHQVEVFSGQPLPQLDTGVTLTPLPSLDLYREPDPFRTPRLSEFHSPIDALEWLHMCTAGFPEPLTFSLRAWAHLRHRRDDFDIVHDNQSLGYGLLRLARAGLPVVATIHHPITVDRAVELVATNSLRRRLTLRRWYGFTRMQGRVARRLPWLTTVSEAARNEIVQAFGVPAERLRVINVGVDTEAFTPSSTESSHQEQVFAEGFHRHATEVPSARIVTVASSDVALKGLADLIEAVAKLNAERAVQLVVVGRLRPGSNADESLTRLGLGETVRFVADLSDGELAGLFRSADVAVVPSRYEGFSLPALEAMACGVPLVVTAVGGLPEVVGPHGHAALHVPPGDPGALARAIAVLLDDSAQRLRMGVMGRRSAVQNFTWALTAARTASWYEDAIEAHQGEGSC